MPYVGFVEHKDSAFFVENNTLMPILHLISNNNTAMICWPSTINRQPSRARTCKPSTVSVVRFAKNFYICGAYEFNARRRTYFLKVFFAVLKWNQLHTFFLYTTHRIGVVR